MNAKSSTARVPAAPPGRLLSSAARRWNGITVELHRFRDVDVVVPVSEHIIGVHLTGAVNLLQSRHGRTCVRHVRAGDVTITPAGEPKRFQHGSENVVLILRLAPSFVQDVAGDEYALDPTRLDLHECFGAPDAPLVDIGRQLLASLELEGAPGRLRAESLATDLSLHLLRHHATNRVPVRAGSTNMPRRKLERAIDYIETHLRDDVALADIAGAVAMSPGHFAHAFKETTGLPPHRFLLERRIEKAKSLLAETDLPITDIAHRVGCASHSHFSVIFHRATGQTPRDFRRQH